MLLPVKYPVQSPRASLIADPTPGDSNTYLIEKQQILWPILAIRTGVWAVAQVSALYGGGIYGEPGATATFPNVLLAPGSLIRIQCYRRTITGTATIKHGGVTVATFDTSNPTIVNNGYMEAVVSGIASIDLDDLVLEYSGGDTYIAQIIIETPSFLTSSSQSHLPWRVDFPPSLWWDTNTIPTRPVNQFATTHWAALENITMANGDETTYKAWFPPGDIDFTIYYRKFSSGGIVKVKVDGVVVDTIDTYSATSAYNQSQVISLGEIGIGVHTISFLCDATSGSGYEFAFQWATAERKTVGTAIPDTGSIIGPESVIIWPYHQTGGEDLQVDITSPQVHYGYVRNTTASTAEVFEYAIHLMPGAYDLTERVYLNNQNATVSITVDGGSVQVTQDQSYPANFPNVNHDLSVTLPSAGSLLQFRTLAKGSVNISYYYRPTVFRLVKAA